MALPAARKYAVAVSIVVAATALRWALMPIFGTTAPYNIFFVALAVTTVLLGIGPGLVFGRLWDELGLPQILASLLEAAAAHDIKGGMLSGLGSTSEVEISFFDPQKKEYLPRVFKEPMEIGSMVERIVGRRLRSESIRNGRIPKSLSGRK